jgi:dihydrodipicolinate synthase/N-acetylneuraminate lyase
VTFFNHATDLELVSQKKYYVYLSKTGLAGLVILGTNPDAFLLTREERAQLISTAREAMGPDFRLMAGVGAHSTKQVLELTADVAKAGAYLPPYPPTCAHLRILERRRLQALSSASLRMLRARVPFRL